MKEKQVKNQEEQGRYSLKGSFLWGILLFLILVLIDQVTKIVADAYFSAEGAPQRIEIIPGWINLCIQRNRGISYGAGSNASPTVKIIVIAATGVMMLALAVFYFCVDKRRSFLRLALVFVVAGGVGNLIDRLAYQVWDPSTWPMGVRDMVDLSRLGFAVCNFADFFITGGAVMLVLALLFFDKDAMFPLTEKYKALAAEAELEEKRKQEKGKNVSAEQPLQTTEKKDE